ncbi:MAG: hypothetical protein IPL46_19750 [Saprospiraceae bacterium]|nr:hypothetical protein [Saprospiraceae bacterium]
MVKKNFDLSREEIQAWLTENDQSINTAEDITQVEEALLHFANVHALPPSPSLREKILAKMTSLNHDKKNCSTLKLDKLPLLDDSSNWLEWREAVESIKSPDHYENVHLYPLESNPKRDLFVVWAKDYVATGSAPQSN